MASQQELHLHRHLFVDCRMVIALRLILLLHRQLDLNLDHLRHLDDIDTSIGTRIDQLLRLREVFLLLTQLLERS
jgi:hypothetical protein